MSTTNLEVAVNCTVRGKVDAEGEYSVPAKLFLDYVSLLPSGKVELALTDEGLEVRSGEQETVLKGLAATEFPVLPKIASAGAYELSLADLKRAISQVAFAVSTSESRPELMGVACFFGGPAGVGKVAFAATDSYRLAERILPVTGNVAEAKYIVPARTFVEVARILGSYKDEMTTPEHASLAFTDNQMVMTYGNVDLVSRLIEGSFPDYRPLVPQTQKTEAVVARSELQKAVRAASLFARQGIFDIHISFDPEKGACAVASADQGTGKTKTMLKGEVTGNANSVMLNFRFLQDGLSAMSTDKIRIRQTDAMNPLLIVPDGGDESYLYVVMPIRQ